MTHDRPDDADAVDARRVLAGDVAAFDGIVPVAFDLDPARLRGQAPDALAGMQSRERNVTVRRLVLTLPARYREPMVLYYFEEMNLAETAKILGLREGTLKARLHRGRELLRRQLTAAGISDLEAFDG